MISVRLLLNPGHAPARRIESEAELPQALKSAHFASGDLALPSPVNAHDHGYGIRTLDFGTLDDALEVWIPGLRLRPRTDPYLEALVAFGRLARTGVGATMHCHNSLNVDRLVDEAKDVMRAAAPKNTHPSLSRRRTILARLVSKGVTPRLCAHMGVSKP